MKINIPWCPLDPNTPWLSILDSPQQLYVAYSINIHLYKYEPHKNMRKCNVLPATRRNHPRNKSKACVKGLDNLLFSITKRKSNRLISLYRSKAKQVKGTSAWVEIPSVRVCECALCAYFVFTNLTTAEVWFIDINDAARRSRADWLAYRQHRRWACNYS